MDDPKKKIDDKQQIKAKEKSPGKLVESQLQQLHQLQNRNIKIELVKKTTTTMTSTKHRIEHEMSKTRQQYEFLNHHNELKTTNVIDKRGELVKRLSQKIEPDRKEKSPDKRVGHLVRHLDKDKATSERKTEPIVEKRNMIETPENGFNLVKAATAASKEEEIIPVVESLSIPSITKTVEDQQPLQLTPPLTPLLIISEPTPPPPPPPPPKCEAEPIERKLSQLITVNDEDDAFRDAIIRDNIIIDESMPTTNNEIQNKDVIIVEEPIKESPPQDVPKDVPKETTTPISTDTMPIIQVIEVNSATTLTTTTTTSTSTTSVISQNEEPISEAKEESSETGTLDNIEKRENENEKEKEKNELEKNSTIECIETAESEVNKTTTPLSDNNTNNNTMNNDNDTNNTNNPTAQQTPESLDVVTLTTTTTTVVEINEAETKVGNSNEDNILTPNTLAEVVQSQENEKICSTTSSSASSSSSSSSSASQSSNATTSKQIIEQDEDVAANNNIITSSTINNEETTPTIDTNSTQVSQQEEAHMTSSTIASTITNHVKDEEQDSLALTVEAAAASYQFDDATLLESPGRARTKLELAAGYGFNEDQIGVFEETFQIFDKDCDGFITLVEIRTVMNALGFFPCDEIIRKSIQNIDSDNSGTVDFEEFICMMSKFRKVKTSSELDDELLEIFKIFDRNHDGFIDKEELKDVLVRLGEKITDEEVADMIKEADLDGDNKVSFSEFRSILHDNRTLSKT